MKRTVYHAAFFMFAMLLFAVIPTSRTTANPLGATVQVVSASTAGDAEHARPEVVVKDDDGDDDDKDELLYHWQNVKYVNDEHRGIAYTCIFLSLVAIASILKGPRRNLKYTVKDSPANRRIAFRGVGLFVLLFALSGATDYSMTKPGVANGYLADASGDRPSTEALAHAAGEFRIAAANIIWMKVVDHYHHQYMAQGGNWAQNKDVLPLIQMITALDPHFIQAYDVGMLILCEMKDYDKAGDFLKQGLTANPNSWELQYDMAMKYAWYQRDPVDALPYAKNALNDAQDPFDQRRLKMLCHTLRWQIAHPKGFTPPVQELPKTNAAVAAAKAQA